MESPASRPCLAPSEGRPIHGHLACYPVKQGEAQNTYSKRVRKKEQAIEYLMVQGCRMSLQSVWSQVPVHGALASLRSLSVAAGPSTNKTRPSSHNRPSLTGRDEQRQQRQQQGQHPSRSPRRHFRSQPVNTNAAPSATTNQHARSHPAAGPRQQQHHRCHPATATRAAHSLVLGDSTSTHGNQLFSCSCLPPPTPLATQTTLREHPHEAWF